MAVYIIRYQKWKPTVTVGAGEKGDTYGTIHPWMGDAISSFGYYTRATCFINARQLKARSIVV